MRILIVGGYGMFGGRLVDLLLDRGGLELIVAGRDIARAKSFCEGRIGQAKLTPLVFDRAKPAHVLQQLKPDVVVDASGPFQVYGDKPYALVEACIEHGCHYLDLADGLEFVAGVRQFDVAAKAASLYVLSGVSSFPVLNAAVVRFLAQDMQHVTHVEAGIAPSPHAQVGLNVIKAIASYAGKPVKLLRKGQWTSAAGFFDSRRFVVNVPGTMPLNPIRFSLAEVPDLQVLKWMRPELETIWVGAGPTPAILHKILWAAAGLVKLRLLPSLLWLAPMMNFVINNFRWGEHRGGMIVQVTGAARGQMITRSWHLLAEGAGGPYIPSMAAAAIIVRQLNGILPEPGARSAHEALEVEHYLPWFERHGIRTGVRDKNGCGTLYQSILGEAYNRLDRSLQHFHGRTQNFQLAGKTNISGGQGLLPRLVRWGFGFPDPGQDVPVVVDMIIDGQREIWGRRFDGKRMQSEQFAGQGRNEGLLIERFGPFRFAMALVEKSGELHLVQRRWSAFGIAMPKWLMPRVTAYETGGQGRHNLHVNIHVPFVGHIVTYEGWAA